jgi:glycosyltransferase involved in cell wall biosynthesis
MSTLALALPGITVATDPRVTVPVVDRGQSVLEVKEMAYPLSASLMSYIGRERRSFDLFHSELSFSLGCLRANVPFGIHIHGVTDLQLLFPSSALGQLLKSPYAVALNNAEYVLCHEAVVGSIRTLRRDAMALQSPINTSQFNPNGPSIRFGPGLALFSPSRIDKWKGHEVIWRALSLMENRARVRVFQSDWGWEPEYSALKASAPAMVRFVPVVPRNQIEQRYRGSDIVVGQMKIGYLGMSELEAAACGVPVTVFSKDRDSPFLPRRSDPQELADLLDLLIDDEHFRANYSKDCRDFVLQNHSLEKVAAGFSNVIEQAGPHPRGARSLGLQDLAHLELGTTLELVERLTDDGRPSELRRRLIDL